MPGLTGPPGSNGLPGMKGDRGDDGDPGRKVWNTILYTPAALHSMEFYVQVLQLLTINLCAIVVTVLIGKLLLVAICFLLVAILIHYAAARRWCVCVCVRACVHVCVNVCIHVLSYCRANQEQMVLLENKESPVGKVSLETME